MPTSEDLQKLEDLHSIVQSFPYSERRLRAALFFRYPNDAQRQERELQWLRKQEVLFAMVAIAGVLFIATLPWWVVDPAHGVPAINDVPPWLRNVLFFITLPLCLAAG